MQSKEIILHEIEIELDKDTHEKLLKLGREEIVKDEAKVLDYIVNKALEYMIKENEGE